MARRTTRHRRKDAPVDFDLTCWYMNQRRVVELVGAESLTSGLSRVGSLGTEDDPLHRIANLSMLKNALVA